MTTLTTVLILAVVLIASVLLAVLIHERRERADAHIPDIAPQPQTPRPVLVYDSRAASQETLNSLLNHQNAMTSTAYGTNTQASLRNVYGMVSIATSTGVWSANAMNGGAFSAGSNAFHGSTRRTR